MKTVYKSRNAIFLIWIGCCTACGNQKAEEQQAMSKGVGPINSYQLHSIDEVKAKEGEELFVSKCSMCHRLDSKLVGPPLNGVTKRRTPEWVLNMILDPEKMIAEDDDAKTLFEQYGAPMINVQLTEGNAQAIYDYLRKVDSK